MKAIIQRIRTAAMFAVLFVLGLASTAWAATQTNPVTGATESYVNTFLGTNSSEWNAAGNWDTGKVPYISGGAYSSALIDGKTASTASASIDGWALQVGAYNGATVTWNSLGKIQTNSGTMWITVDDTSSITINGWGSGNLGNSGYALNYYVAAANGVAWNADISAATREDLTMNYYLAGNGSVSYQALGKATHVIKQADVTLSGTSRVEPKILVSFTSTTKTFTADAAIKVYGTDGTTLVKTYNLAEVKTASTLTTSDPVGTCELVQTSTGIVLYYVDGDPNAVETYKPSININFTNGAGNGLTTSADVGLDGYAVPGTSWNNFVVANNATFNTVNAIDSTGAASVASGVSVSISGTRGHWNCSNLTPASNPLHGYIDESTDYPTPTVTITGIPYEHYRVIVYHSTDTANAQFGYDTINGFNFTYVDGVQQTGTTSWGSAGASNSAEAIAEGVNTLVSAVLTGDTVTMVAHRIGGSYPSARGCFAAIQVVEYVPEVSENDLEIAVDGATEYEVNEAKELSGTVYLTGSGTLTLTGSDKITAATIDVAKDVVLNINADRLDATTFTGSGTVVYDTTAPVTGKGWAAIGWSGTVWVKNQAVSNFNGNNFGNAASTIRFTGVTGYLSRKTSDNVTQSVPIELVDDGNTVAFSYNNGWGGSVVSISTLKGTGTLKTSSAGNGEIIYIANADGFTGSFDLAHKKVQLGGSEPSGNDQYWNGRLYIPSGVTATQAAGTTWSANNSIDIAGTLYANGTLASSHASQAVIGSGTVVFTGRAPTPTGDTWWKNTSWTGTVQMKDVTNLVGASTYNGANFLPNDYGNTGSVLELYNCSGWLPNNSNYQCTVPLKITGTLTINNGISGSKFVISSLSGDGTIYTDFNTATITIQVLEAENFTGYVKLNSKRVVFGDTLPSEFTAGQIYIGEGFTLTAPNSALAWWAQGGITLAGELKAAALSNFGDGTTITTTDTGVFTLTSTGNGTEGETDTDYARIQGTGSLKYEGAGWRALTTNKLSTAVALVNEQAGDILLSRALTYTIGSLSGSKNFQGNYGSGKRYLNVIQSKDTEWSGKVVNDGSKRFAGLKLDASSTGTLTLSGTASQEVALEVNGGAVNLTGTWVGATTVAGTFGGTGTLTGNLTFSDGATFKVFDAAGDGTEDPDADGLNVSGAVTVGDSGTVTVTIADGASIASETVILTATSIGGTFTLDPSLADVYELITTTTTLTIRPIIYASDGETVAGYMDGTTAVVTNTAGMVTIPDNATAITIYLDGGNPSFAISTATYLTIAQSGANGFTVYAKYGESVYNVTGAFPLISNPTSYTATESGYEMTFALDASKGIVIDSETINVKPALDTSATPMAVDATEAEFTVKTIPGLFYGVVYGSDNSTFKAKSGNVVQATTTSTTLEAPTDDIDGVRYFKIQVGVAASDFEVYSEE